MTSQNDRPKALDALRALLLITKHLDTLLPLLLSLYRIPANDIRRVGLLQTIARGIADNHELATDWYRALELLSGEELSGSSVADLLKMSVELLGPGTMADLWQAAFSISLIDEELIQQWILFGGLTDGSTSSSGRTS